MQYWILKTEPEAFSFNDLVREGKTIWDGVRNYQARNNLKAMKKGDLCLIYHSVSDKALVGIAQVNKEFFQDPTTNDTAWVSVEIIPSTALKRKVTLSEIKADESMAELPLVRHSRLSVLPISKKDYDYLIMLSQKS